MPLEFGSMANLDGSPILAYACEGPGQQRLAVGHVEKSLGKAWSTQAYKTREFDGIFQCGLLPKFCELHRNNKATTRPRATREHLVRRAL